MKEYEIKTLVQPALSPTHPFRDSARPLRLDRRRGAHLCVRDGTQGVAFSVAAPHATHVAVVGDFNVWNGAVAPMRRGDDGVWECFVPGVAPDALYKFRIRGRDGAVAEKNDPFATAHEQLPGTASRVWDLTQYRWSDDEWLTERADRQRLGATLAIYELHLGSWCRNEHGNTLSYRELAPRLADYVTSCGFSHVELLPVAEHPFDGSWGYQTLGFFAPTRRFGSPDDFRYLVDSLHQAGLGVIVDWVPGHFPDDVHGLVRFDGTTLYEHDDPRQRRHPDWNTLVFDFGQPEVVDFLIASALFWFEHYHVDGFRVDAVASMLYLDYSRLAGEWTPNVDGGTENYDAVRFLQQLNDCVHHEFPDTLMIAEESTAWPRVTGPTDSGGLGFDYKWSMGWMHDLLDFMHRPPADRPGNLDRLTKSLEYAYAERFVLPLSHDEVVHGKGSLRSRMPGCASEQFASIRLLYGWMFGHPGAKLVFMGNELGQPSEWDHQGQLDWRRLESPLVRGLRQWVADLNQLYRLDPALSDGAGNQSGFEWIERGTAVPGVVSFLRRDPGGMGMLLFVSNFTDRTCESYVNDVPVGGFWVERLNSDAEAYGGENRGNLGGRSTDRDRSRPEARLTLRVPALTTLVLAPTHTAKSDVDLEVFPCA